MRNFLALAGSILLGVGIGLLVYGGLLFTFSTESYRKDLPALVPGLTAPSKSPPVIRLHDAETLEFFCSGTVIGSNYAITAAHCVAGRSNKKATVQVRALDGTISPKLVTPVFAEGRSDLALLLGDFTEFNPMVVSFNPKTILNILINPMLPVLACGFPQGGDLFCSPMTDRYQALFGIAGQGFLYPGMSGGPVLVLIEGTPILLGVNTSVMEHGIYISPLIELLVMAKVKVDQP